MKRSNILIFLPVLLILVSLVFYNFKLKELYDGEDYKNPYYGMEFTPMSGVEKLNLKTSYNIKIQIEQGEKEGLWIDTRIKYKTKYSINGDVLNIDLQGNKNYANEGSIFIITKKINDLVVNHNEYKDKESYFQGNINIKNYNLDKLNLELSGSLNVQLDDMKIDTLTAVVGQNIGYSMLNLSNNAQVNVADYDIGTRGGLRLSGTNIKTSNRDNSKNVASQK